MDAEVAKVAELGVAPGDRISLGVAPGDRISLGVAP